MPIDDEDDLNTGSGRAIDQTWTKLHPEDAVTDEDEDMDATEALGEDEEDEEEIEHEIAGDMTGDPVDLTERRDPFSGR
jgi:hypothetical protein